jgi:integrase
MLRLLTFHKHFLEVFFMSNIIISNTALENIQRPTTGKKRFVIRDRTVGGFYCIVGMKRISFRLAYSAQGKRHDVNLGRTPLIDADLARKRALSLLAGFELPQSPHLLEAQTLWQTPEDDGTVTYETLRQLLARYHVSKQLADATKKGMIKSFNQGLSDWLDKPALKLTPTEFETIYRGMLERGIESSARMMARYTRAVFRWAELADPTAKLTQKTGHSANKVEARDRRIEAHQMQTFKSIMPQLTSDQQLTIMVALTTGMRKSELQSVTSLSLCHQTQSIKLARTKNGKSHTVPLPHQLWKQLVSEGSKKKSNEPLLSIGDHLPKVFTRVIPLSWHDCRRSCASTMASLGEPEALIKTVLNHLDKKNVTQAHYLRFDLEQQRAALQKVYDQFQYNQYVKY